jgi:DNA-binding LytR/AlgR family response regulator
MTGGFTKQLLRTIIVDDEPLAVARLQLLCAEQANIELVGTASDGAAALLLAQALAPDLLFLDIGMPVMDGIHAARALSLLPNKPAIIFVTAYDNFAVEAYDLDIVDYVLKPVSPDRLNRAIQRAILARAAINETKAEIKADDNYATEFWVSHRSELIRVAAIDIERIEAERDYMRLFTGGRSYLLHQTISSLEQRLNPAHFLRIHRSHIIRRDLITGLRHEGGGVWYALLQGDNVMRIGRKYLPDVKQLAGK